MLKRGSQTDRQTEGFNNNIMFFIYLRISLIIMISTLIRKSSPDKPAEVHITKQYTEENKHFF